jgi:tRNA dimethylallyltransferase
MQKTFVLVICGPTASGKTRLAVDLALEFNGEIVSADSMQIYQGMNIATAKPTEEEKKGVPHHLMDFLPYDKEFSVAQYVALAKEVIKDINDRGKLPVIVGGTGLYIRSLINNIHFDETEKNTELRESLRLQADTYGNEYLLNKLAEIDPETAQKLHPNNLNRIIRALEVYETTGLTMSQLQLNSKKTPSPYKPCILMPFYPDRQVLYDRINTRVDEMLKQGLLEEARTFYSLTREKTSAQAIGYKELAPYFLGYKSLDTCIERLKQCTRQYAKRQLTWFLREPRIEKLIVEKDTKYEEILNTAKNLVKVYSNL